MSYRFTVFTPTYNRAYTLQRVFDSLMAQTSTHDVFEWIVIDDGSTDDTRELIGTFIEKADFRIRPVYQENRGKNYCHNKAVTMAEGELFLILDSDDAIVPECMEVFWDYWIHIDQNIKDDIYGINCLCKNGYTDELIGHPVQEGLMDDAYRWKYANRVFFEAWGALNTKLFKRYLFPEIEGVKFIPEAYLWDSVGNGRKVFATNEILRVVYHQDDGFTNDIIRSYKNHSRGRYIYHKLVINELFWKLMGYNPIRLLKDMIQFGRMGLHSGYGLYKILSDINGFYKKFLFVFCLPLSAYFYYKDGYSG